MKPVCLQRKVMHHEGHDSEEFPNALPSTATAAKRHVSGLRSQQHTAAGQEASVEHSQHNSTYSPQDLKVCV